MGTLKIEELGRFPRDLAELLTDTVAPRAIECLVDKSQHESGSRTVLSIMSILVVLLLEEHAEVNQDLKPPIRTVVTEASSRI